MSEEQKPDPAALQVVADALEGISKAVEKIAKDAGVQLVTLAKKSRAQRRTNRVMAVSIAVDVVFSVLVGLGFFVLDENTDQVNDNTRRIDVSQTTTRRQALCPLYTLFRDMRSPQGRAAAEDPEQYDHSFDVIEQGYTALECGEFISQPQGPPGSTPTP